MMLVVRTLRESRSSLPSRHHAERSWLLSEAPDARHDQSRYAVIRAMTDKEMAENGKRAGCRGVAGPGRPKGRARTTAAARSAISGFIEGKASEVEALCQEGPSEGSRALREARRVSLAEALAFDGGRGSRHTREARDQWLR
jgi:hypothetical protein